MMRFFCAWKVNNFKLFCGFWEPSFLPVLAGNGRFGCDAFVRLITHDITKRLSMITSYQRYKLLIYPLQYYKE